MWIKAFQHWIWVCSVQCKQCASIRRHSCTSISRIAFLLQFAQCYQLAGVRAFICAWIFTLKAAKKWDEKHYKHIAMAMATVIASSTMTCLDCSKTMLNKDWGIQSSHSISTKVLLPIKFLFCGVFLCGALRLYLAKQLMRPVRSAQIVCVVCCFLDCSTLDSHNNSDPLNDCLLYFFNFYMHMLI